LLELTTQHKAQTAALHQAQQVGIQATTHQAEAEKQAADLAETQRQTEAERDNWLARLQQFVIGLQDQHATGQTPDRSALAHPSPAADFKP
jgi:hypothetical protein